MKDSPKVLVTGGAGFIGSHLVEKLRKERFNVVVVDNLSEGEMKNLEKVQEAIKFYKLDLREEEFLSLIEEEIFDFIFHLAGTSYVLPSIVNPWFDFENTLIPSMRILESLRKNKLKTKLLLASSAAVYGNPMRIPINEEEPTSPISPYGVTRLAIEKYASIFNELYGVKVVLLRIFSTYGPRQKKQIVYDFMRNLEKNPEEIEILGDGTQVRDFIYVKDNVDAMLKVALRGEFNGKLYNIASGTGVTTVELAKEIASLMGVNPNFKFTGSIRPGDPEKWVADIHQLKQLGYTPHYSLRDGLRETIEWYFRK